MKNIKKFLILSHGSSATIWLANSLNFISRINCSSALCNNIALPKDVISKTKHLNILEKFPAISELMSKKSMSEIFNSIHLYSKMSDIIGDVHGFYYQNYIKNIVLHGRSKNINIISLSRHPITWFISKIKDRNEHFKNNKNIKDLYRKFFRKIYSFSDFVFFPKSSFTLCFLVELEKVFLDYIDSLDKQRLCNNYKIEKLMDVNSKEFNNLLLDISKGEVFLNDSIKTKIFDKKNLAQNTSTSTGNQILSTNPEYVFNNLSYVEQKYFRKVLKRPKVQDVIDFYGYDISFI